MRIMAIELVGLIGWLRTTVAHVKNGILVAMWSGDQNDWRRGQPSAR